MLTRMLQTGLFAGFITALIYSVIQSVTVTPLIYEAEQYERVSSIDDRSIKAANTDKDIYFGEEIKRHFLTLLTNIVAAIGFAFLIVAGFVLSKRKINFTEGMWWGLSGYIIFILAPALGLPPEIPGSISSPVEGRQIWWVSTIAATTIGIGIGFFIKNIYVRFICILIITLPHLIGPPNIPDIKPGLVPLELASHYVVWTLFTSLVFWLILGASSGLIYKRLTASSKNK
ncbi:MAG: CbtA family protein [Alphaproteobacteria bacterium]|nr:CbtA family protein [Alphaproteobacteria bacterium]